MEILIEERAVMEMKTEQMMATVKDLSSEANQIEEELYNMQIEELKVSQSQHSLTQMVLNSF